MRRGGAASLRSTERERAEEDEDGDTENGDLGPELAACQQSHGNRCCQVPQGKLHLEALQKITC